MKNDSTTDENFVTLLISAIPKSFHSADLRHFFSVFVETKAFRCFHFRHRPMPPASTDDEKTSKTSQSFICFIQIYQNRVKEFIRLYHRKHWINGKGIYFSSLCLINEVTNENDDENLTKTLIEFKPPKYLYPQGNVGTPTAFFFNEVNACRLPASIIKKLGLVFPKCRSKRKYGCVGFDYKTIIEPSETKDEEFDEFDLKTADGHEILSEQDKKSLDELNKRKIESTNDNDEKEEDEEEDDEEDELEEWDRHEAQYDDVTKQDRTSPYFFEHKIELKWEKGGSGVVFYTDDVFWKEHEGKDFDNLDMADDWDIDMRMYDKTPGLADRDGNELQNLRREENLREGRIGAFEKFTKGIGRRLLERAGWQDGQGLGSSVIGMAEALTAEGGKLSSKDKTGLGFSGEKVKRSATNEPKPRKEFRITTIYDDPDETDPIEPMNRRSDPTQNKNRIRKSKNIFK